jgi:hypothetical protein
MIVVAGPPGSGKSVLFPVHSFEIDYFNADDRSAQLNGGSYRGISLEPGYDMAVVRHILHRAPEPYPL